MHTLELNQVLQTFHELFADEIVDFKKDIDREVLKKIEAKDALHKVIDKEREILRYCDQCGSYRCEK